MEGGSRLGNTAMAVFLRKKRVTNG